MKRSLVLATDLWGPAIALARAAEEHGLHRVWTTEHPTRDAAVRALALGLNTSRLQVATGIAYAFTRHPLATATMAADIQMATRGRFTIGLGAGTRGMRAKFYGGDQFDHPAPRLAEYVKLMKASWSAPEGLHFAGDFYAAAVPGFRPNRELTECGPPPVYGSGLNSAMISYAAASCDGVAVHPLASAAHYFEQRVLPALERGQARSGRPVRVAAWLMTSVNEDVDTARTRAKANLAFYLSTPSYRTAVAGTPWEQTAETVRDRFRAEGPAWSRLAEAIPEDMVDAFSLAGTPEAVALRLPQIEREFAARGVDELVFQAVGVDLDNDQTRDNCMSIIETVGSRT